MKNIRRRGEAEILKTAWAIAPCLLDYNIIIVMQLSLVDV